MCMVFIADFERQIPTGSVAHLGERLHGMEEVEGSIPFRSTRIADKVLKISGLFCFLNLNLIQNFFIRLWYSLSELILKLLLNNYTSFFS